ncbi:MAG: flagellar basal-body rod protein FlgF [candidate division Zixibacteria bacterium]|nr:flagellar basal-body rod protein FlgF [candidate division Zixibacteria bacterium]
MIKGIYTSGSGMLPRVLKQEVFANNMANANTVGYKKDNVFLQQLENAKQKAGLVTDLEWEIPMVDDVYIDFGQGQLSQTNQPLDIALEGEGFFVVDTPDGERYSRNGAFGLTAEGTLVDGNGNSVLSDAGPITIAGDEISISNDGGVFVDGAEAARIRVVDFEKPYDLRKVDDGYFMPEDETILPEAATGFSVRQGYVETSNVNIIQNMVDMLVSFRAYQSGQKAIQAQDETLDKAVNDLGRVR